MDKYPSERPVTLRAMTEWWAERYIDPHPFDFEMTKEQLDQYEAQLLPEEKVYRDGRPYFKGGTIWPRY